MTALPGTAAAGGPDLGRRDLLALLVGLAAGVLIRSVLLPQTVPAGDVNDFLGWARSINAGGLSRAYDQPISFPPVLPWIWWLLGMVAPGLLNPNANDPLALALIKVPASIADLAIAGVVGSVLAGRGRPGWAIAASVAVLLVPTSWYVSAWWAQFDALYVLPLLIAWVLLTRDRPNLAAVAIGIALMTKPQALPLAVPFAAFYLRRIGAVGSARAALVATATAVVLWLPFLAANGLANYLRHLGDYTALFAVLSLRAWNPWWILTDLAGSGQLIADDISIAGPVTLRWLGYAVALFLGLMVFIGVWRRPTPSGLAWGLAAASLAAFIGLTAMHERYAVSAVTFLVLCWPNRLAIGTWLLLALIETLNIVAAVPPDGGPGSLVPLYGPIALIGSLAMTGAFIATLVGLSGGAGDVGEPSSADAGEWLRPATGPAG